MARGAILIRNEVRLLWERLSSRGLFESRRIAAGEPLPQKRWLLTSLEVTLSMTL
jgi:hypothetical protein